MEVIGQLQDPSALSPGKDQWYPVGLDRLQSWTGSLRQDKSLLPRRESNRSSSFVQTVVKFLHRPSHHRSCRSINIFCVETFLLPTDAHNVKKHRVIKTF